MIAYVIASYFGDRRVSDPVYEADRWDYVNRHLEQLEKLDTSYINRIVVVTNGNYASGGWDSYPPFIGTIPLQFLHRSNEGMSYGAWNYAYKKLRRKCEFMFVIEDDYIPVADNFDHIFLERMGPKTGYVCSLYQWGHSSISNGLVRVDALEDIKGVPNSGNSDYFNTEQKGQVAFSKHLEKAGWGVEDIASDYEVPFVNHAGHFLYYGKQGAQRVISPVMIERNDTSI